MTGKDWTIIKKNIEAGIYRTIRLVKKQEGKPDIILVNANKVSSTVKDAISRMEYIKQKTKELEPGSYQIQCKQNGGSVQDNYDFEIKQRTTLEISANGTHKIIDKTKEQVTETGMVEFDKYMEVFEELAELRAKLPVLQAERDMYLRMYNKELAKGLPNKALSDEPEEKSSGDKWVEGLQNLAAGLTPVLEQVFSLQNRKMDLQEKQLLMADKKTTKKKIYPKRDVESEANALADHLEALCDQDEDAYNQELDELEQSDPELYEMVCGILGIEEYDENENENQEGGEE